MSEAKGIVKTKVISLGDLKNSEILPSSDFRFIIPSIQRDYQWGIGNDEDESGNDSAYAFIEDLVRFNQEAETHEDPYFLGTFIVYRQKDGDVNVMDGQQRWTTITALMAAIYNLIDSSLTSNKEFTEIKNEIVAKFLKTAKGEQVLVSKVELDNKLIEIMCDFDSTHDFEDEQFDEQWDSSTRYKRDKRTFFGRNLFCVLQYFLHKLKLEFHINGPMSARAPLIQFYKNIRDRVLINLTLSESSKLAYRMFVTANARGTPLTNFDILRGLVLARFQQLTGRDNSKKLNDIFSDCDIDIEKICGDLQIGEKNSKINGIISDALGARIGTKITHAGAMGYLENEINKLDSLDELIIFTEYFQKFLLWYQHLTYTIQNSHRGYPGVSVYSQFRYAQKSDHQSFVLLILAYIMDWRSEFKRGLMNVVRAYYVRTDICTGSGAKVWHGLIPKYAFRILNPRGEDSRELIKKLANDLSTSSSNPSNEKLIQHLQINQSITKSNKKMITLFYGIENYDGKVIKSNGKKYGYCSSLMPIYDYDIRDSGWHFGVEEKRHPGEDTKTIGNYFLLNDIQTNINKISTTDPDKRISEFREKSSGITSGEILLEVEEWGSEEIIERTQYLAGKINDKFPETCFRDEWLN